MGENNNNPGTGEDSAHQLLNRNNNNNNGGGGDNDDNSSAEGAETVEGGVGGVQYITAEGEQSKVLLGPAPAAAQSDAGGWAAMWYRIILSHCHGTVVNEGGFGQNMKAKCPQ